MRASRASKSKETHECQLLHVLCGKSVNLSNKPEERRKFLRRVRWSFSLLSAIISAWNFSRSDSDTFSADISTCTQGQALLFSSNPSTHRPACSSST